MVIVSKTKNVAVYNKLRQGIIKGKLKPGQKVVMAERDPCPGSDQKTGRRGVYKCLAGITEKEGKHGFWNSRKKSHCRGCERRVG